MYILNYNITIIGVMLLDTRMLGKSGVEVVKYNRTMDNDIKIIMLNTFYQEEYIYIEALANDDYRYLLKDIESDTLKDTIRKTYEEGFIMPSKVAKVLGKKTIDVKKEKHNCKIDILLGHEKEISTMIEKGFTNKEIASALYMS